ncbi:hypothetical protein [Thiohalocapsa sp. ML1]|jgi:hypothetical protein|uniref:hypothetical protein n=1 Tax=Thiohalocapsa sp. ML1 TaxID=1431688 RepID=UPI00073203AC|nr:hypothetical protein [Thiohalocapsa sp. ML1]
MNDYGMKLWGQGARSNVQQFFYDLPLNLFKRDDDGLVFASIARQTEDGPESCFFVIRQESLLLALEAVAGAKLFVSGEDAWLSMPLSFDVTAVLTEPHGDFVPFVVKEIHLSKSQGLPARDHCFDDVDYELGEEDEDEDDDEWDDQYFPIAIEYMPVIDRLAASCSKLLKRPGIDPQTISDIAKLQYALSRLPMVTDGIEIDVLLKSVLDEEGSWSGPSLYISGSNFRLSYAGYIRGPYGGDSDCSTIYECERSGFRSDLGGSAAGVIQLLTEWIDRWEADCTDLGVEFSITNDEEEFDWDQDEDDDAWERMPTNYG